MSRFAIYAPWTLLAGCGLTPAAAPPACVEGEGCAEAPLVLNAADPDSPATSPARPPVVAPATAPEAGTAPVVEPVLSDSSIVSSPGFDALSSNAGFVDPFELTSPLFDPLGFSPFGLNDVPDLVSLFVDGIILGQLTPSGPALNLTFLERLCLEGDTPDSFCRQRFGN